MEDIYDHFSPRLTNKIIESGNYITHVTYIIIIIVIVLVLYKYVYPMLKKWLNTHKKSYNMSRKTNIHSLVNYNAPSEAITSFPLPINTN